MSYYAIGYIDDRPDRTMQLSKARYTSVDDALESILSGSSYMYALENANLVKEKDSARIDFQDGSSIVIYKEA